MPWRNKTISCTYSMPAMWQAHTFYTLHPTGSSKQCRKVTIVILTVCMKKLRHRKLIQSAWGCTPLSGNDWDWNLSRLHPRSTLLCTRLSLLSFASIPTRPGTALEQEQTCSLDPGHKELTVSQGREEQKQILFNTLRVITCDCAEPRS